MTEQTEKKLAKPSKGEIARAREYIKAMDWRFARSMPQWPHWYVFREDGSAREFDFIARLLKKFGYEDIWGRRKDSYMLIGRFKYWVIEDVLNRAEPLSNAEVRRRGLRYLARHGQKVGPYGRPISVKKRRGRKRS